MRFFVFVTVVTIALATGAGCLPPPATEPPPVDRGNIETEASVVASKVVFGDMVELSAATPAGAGAVSYYWVQTAGAGVRLSDARVASPSFAAPSLAETTTLRFRVLTRNDAGDVGDADVEVTVEADPDFGTHDAGDGGSAGTNRPVARAGRDQEVAPGAKVTLSGTSSTGRSLSFRWQQLSGTDVTLKSDDTDTVTFEAPQRTEGSEALEFELRVSDIIGLTSRDTVVVTVSAASSSDGGTGSDPNPRVLFSTTMGDFTVELDREAAPISVDNFLLYVEDGFYVGTIFHRVIPGFVVQGGGFEVGLSLKETRDPITNESDNGLKNDRATIAMARTSDVNSATSQFYVNLVDNDALNASSGNNGYAVFGRVVQGMSVIDAIALIETASQGGMNDVPVQDVIINSAERLPAEEGGG